MSRIVKTLLVLLATLVGVVAIAAVAFLLFFDPNDFKEEISASVKKSTGRELRIEGDLSLSLFPWLAIEMGRTELGNAENFSDDPFLVIEQASLSVRMLPLILKQQATIGTATIDGLVVNLEVASNGRTNWDDFSELDDADSAVEASADPTEFNISGFVVSNARISYADAQAGSTYVLSDLNFETGGIAANEPIDLDAEFDFLVATNEASTEDMSGHLTVRGTATASEDFSQLALRGLNVSGELNGITSNLAEFNFDAREVTVDTVAENINAGEMDLSLFGVAMSANVAPFSYAGTPQPKAQLRVPEFSLKRLLQALDIEAPLTADPDAMSRVSFEANAAVGENDMTLTDLKLQLDDSNMTGRLAVPLSDAGALTFDLIVDAINIDAYMAPAEDGSAASTDGDEGDIEIPADMIRTLNAKGKFRLQRASLSGLEFTNMQVGLLSADGRLRLNPLSADLYEGTYNGDVRIDASQDIPSISVNERIAGVKLTPLVKSMFEQDNISGEINGSFVLSGAGRNVSSIRRDLDGNMTFELLDGAFEGTDVWYEMRKARALFKQEPAPQAKLPARTEFSTVKATGTVTDGIFENNDLLVELPFLRITGNGQVDLNAAQINYGMQARVLQKPELMKNISEAELADFTEVVIPLRVTGALSAPSIKPDIEGLVRDRAKQEIDRKADELKERLFNRLLGGEDKEATDGEGAGESAEGQTEEVPEEDPEEQLKRKLLEKLIGN